MVILGFDPGLATLGYGVIEKDEKGNCRAIDCGIVQTPKGESLAVRLCMLEQAINQIIEKFKPNEIAMEELFFAKNVKTALSVAHARGVLILCCNKACGRIFEYTPLQIKQSLTGYGRADKKQMQKMVKMLLNLNKVPSPDDAADALAVALTHARVNKLGEHFII
ncbi:MAG: crossover junction endodeoxyribonuclease RuvC [Clostridia bacterium]|nr:crossover junction endodeoxyribonuclease RuvC [Clostridia bacterium]